MCSTAHSEKAKANVNSEFTASKAPDSRYFGSNSQLLLLDPNHQVVTRISVCAIITFLSIFVWWSAWIPLTFGGLIIVGYAMGYRVVSDEPRKRKLKNEEFDAI